MTNAWWFSEEFIAKLLCYFDSADVVSVAQAKEKNDFKIVIGGQEVTFKTVWSNETIVWQPGISVHWLAERVMEKMDALLQKAWNERDSLASNLDELLDPDGDFAEFQQKLKASQIKPTSDAVN